ncbi:MAG: hypothetical protein U0U46_04010 [Saprospiraceae bacterium]|nr:hypothetical protein [Saprospiraceae bacterium]
MKNIGVRYGLLAAAAVVFYFAILYFVKKELFLHTGLQWASMFLYLAFMYKACLDDCAAHGTNRDFRAIVRIPFIVFLLANLGYWLFFYGIHLADKSLIVMELERKVGILQAQMNEVTDPVTRNDLIKQINEFKAYMNSPVQPLGPILAQMAQGAIGGFVLAAGVAWVIRSQKQH